MAAPRNQGLITEAGLFIISESGDYIVTEAFTTQGGGKAKPTEIKEDNSELWEIGASIYRINDNPLKEPVNIKKYITEENDIKVIIGENIYLKSSDVITENVTAKLSYVDNDVSYTDAVASDIAADTEIHASFFYQA